jgi:hypothetical protein
MDKLPPGEYYVGDLCYVLSGDSWDELHSLCFVGEDIREGIFELHDGRVLATFGTAYGDGTYISTLGTKHSVDSGSIGCILLSSIEKGSANIARLGAVVVFDEPFSPSSDGETISFGNKLQIPTGAQDEDYYDYDDFDLSGVEESDDLEDE